MVTLAKKRPSVVKIANVPSYLIKEEIEEKAYYYKGYEQVLHQEKKQEDIMGTSGLQAFIVEILLDFLFQNLGRKKYRFLTNEVGAHIRKGTNLSFDLAVYDKKVLTFDQINENYVAVPPKIVFEIDVKVEIEDENAIDYINKKTEVLLEYGTELIVWVLTKQQKLLVARPASAWQMVTWDKDIEIMDGVILNIANLIKAEEALG